MPHYGETLKRAVAREVGWESSSSSDGLLPLSGLKIVVNPGSGAGCFFVDVLRDLGADVSGSIHTVPDGTFPVTFGVPNPEKKAMVDETMRACAACGADLGIMFDTE
jgi:phosphomannomutase